MKAFRIILAVVSALAGTAVFGQQAKPAVEFPEYQFTVVKENPITSVKNQYRSGTCWVFSALGFVESEVIRINGIEDKAQYPDFSEMYVVSKSYFERGIKYVRMDGCLGFSAGSEADDVLHVIRDYGLVPQSAMSGMNYGTELPVQGEMDAVLKGFIDAASKNPNRKLTTAWKRAFQGILDAYLGECPEIFTVDGKEYTPASYRDALKFNPDDYVTLTSFTHHPFYTQFAIEVCDNWRGDLAYNVPIDEFMSVLEDAVMNGYTVAWGSDVSEPGFTRNGMAVLVNTEVKQTAGSDQERWVGPAAEKPAAKSGKKDAKKDVKPAIPEPVEFEVTQESRQEEFDNKQTTDDHGMQIYGIAKDQNGKKYYMVKNSWGETGKYKGIWYATEAFVKGKSLDILVHKDALPQALKDKLGIK
ncbi:MAG: aminopeptidase [Bacteroidales bacterium]|nr:aminopeptidase [Bacteroidales bacterium]